MIVTTLRNLFIYLFIIGFFFFPNLQTVFIILGFGLTLFIPKQGKIIQLNLIGISMILFFVVYALGMLYSEDVNAGSKALQVKIPFLIFPFFLPVIFSNKKETNLSYLRVFAYAGSAYVLLSLMKAVYVCFVSGGFSAFFSEQFYFQVLSSQIILHPTYGSVYFNLLFFLTGVFYLNNVTLFTKNNTKNLIAVAMLSIVFIVLSVSKLGFLMFLVNVILLLVYFAITKHQILKTLLLFVAFLTLVTTLVYTVNPLKIRFEQAYHELTVRNVNPDDYYMSTGTRLWTWKVTEEIIKENSIVGIGTGDFKNAIEQKYQEKNMVSFKGLDSHQQYLQTRATVGFFGVTILVLLFLILFYLAIKNKNIVLLFLGLMYALWGLTESMLERQSGVLFFVFFVYLLNSLITSEKRKVEN